MRRLTRLVLALVVLLLAVSCGGGGGNKPATPPPPVVPPPPAVPHSLSKVAGDGQTAAPAAVVAVAPEVVVVDSAGAPVADTEVAFVVNAGGGSVQTTSARTNGAGRASCGAWTLGSAKGLNSLSASVAGLVPVTFSATAAYTSADVSVSVLAPSPGRTVGEAMTVTATVISTYQLATVTASVDVSSVQLNYGPYGQSGNAWQGVLSLAGRPRGDVVLVVTAADTFGHLTDRIVPVILDRAPAVTVSAPSEGIVARPKADIVATCADDDTVGCVSLTATVSDKVIASGKDSISQEVDFSAYEGQRVSLDMKGVDSNGQRTTVTRTLFVESSTHLSVMAEVSGPVWDVSHTRILFVDVAGTTPTLKVLDTATGKSQAVEEAVELIASNKSHGFLIPAGAIYVRGEPTSWALSQAGLYEWRAGAVTRIADATYDYDTLRVAGGWAIYESGIELWVRNLGTGASTLLVEGLTGGHDVASNGDVVYSREEGADWNIYRWRTGTTTALTADSYLVQTNLAPRTDGELVVYTKASPCCSNQTIRIAVQDGSNESYLTAPTARFPGDGSWYAVSGGYVAYGVEDATAALQIWRHSSGGEQQLSFFGSSSVIDAIAPDGTVLFTQKQKRYRAVPGAALQEIGSSLGRVIVRDGKFLVLLDRTVLEVGP